MCHSYAKTQRRLKARRRASHNRPDQNRRRQRLIDRCVWAYKMALGIAFPEGYPKP